MPVNGRWDLIRRLNLKGKTNLSFSSHADLRQIGGIYTCIVNPVTNGGVC